MLRLTRKLAPLTMPTFCKAKPSQYGLKKPPTTLRPAPPGFRTSSSVREPNNVTNKNKTTPGQINSLFQSPAGIEIKPEKETFKLEKKYPVITIMGHVDHGKTTLIDYLRNSDIAAKEDGGITQRIGAFRINYSGQRITFIDTPGHEAFTNMRKRGASMTDLIVLMVSAVEGVKRQTLEIIELVKKMELPVIVAINKIDLPQADPESIEREIQQAGLDIQPLGGDIPVVHISAKTGMNIDLLCELITQQTKNLTAVFEGLAEASVLEAKQTSNMNSMTLIIEKGTLKPGSLIILGKQSMKIKTILDDRGEMLKEAYPGDAVQITGIPFVPLPGDQIFEVDSNEKAQMILQKKKSETAEVNSSKAEIKNMKTNISFQRRTREGRRERRAFFRGVQEVWMRKFEEQENKLVEKIEELREKLPDPMAEALIDELQGKLEAHKQYVFEYLKNTGASSSTLNFIMKFGDRGMEETIMLQLEKLKPAIESETKVKLNLIKSDVGDITPRDLEQSQNFNAKIFTFGAGISTEAKGQLEGVEKPKTHKLIHTLLKDLKDTSFAKKIQSIKGVERGRCQVSQIYNLSLKKKQVLVPGIKVTSGKVMRKYKCYIFRNGIPTSNSFQINKIKSFKKEMVELKKGEEGTVILQQIIEDIQKGDELVFFEE